MLTIDGKERFWEIYEDLNRCAVDCIFGIIVKFGFGGSESDFA